MLENVPKNAQIRFQARIIIINILINQPKKSKHGNYGDN